jgi:hypothetical protein
MAGDGPFCPGCGQTTEQPAARAGTTADPILPAAPAPAPAPVAVLIAAAGALGLVAIAVATIILLTGGNSSGATTQSVTVYQRKVTAALGPVLAANKNLSSALQAIDGRRRPSTPRGTQPRRRPRRSPPRRAPSSSSPCQALIRRSLSRSSGC